MPPDSPCATTSFVCDASRRGGYNWRWFALSCAAAATMAAEAHVDDLRAVIELRPTAFTYTWEDTLGSRSGDDSFNQAWGVGLGWRRGWGSAGRPWLALAGVEALALHQAGDGIVGNGMILRAEAGVGLALSHDVALTLMPMLGYGRMHLEAKPTAAAEVVPVGRLTDVGVRAGVRYRCSDRWSIGCEIGWLRSDEHLTGDDAELRLTASGAHAGLSLAWTIDPLPKPLQ